jgi:hypothetical protein
VRRRCAEYAARYERSLQLAAPVQELYDFVLSRRERDR